MSMLAILFDHVAWADARTRDAILTLASDSPEGAQATRLYAHIAAAEHVWLARIEGRAPVHAIWPDLSLDNAAALAAESTAALRSVADRGDDELMREAEYQNSTGKTFHTRIVDMLVQAALHGTYHRGQIALLTRQGGGTPAVTDYIAFVRDVTARPQGPT